MRDLNSSFFPACTSSIIHYRSVLNGNRWSRGHLQDSLPLGSFIVLLILCIKPFLLLCRRNLFLLSVLTCRAFNHLFIAFILLWRNGPRWTTHLWSFHSIPMKPVYDCWVAASVIALTEQQICVVLQRKTVNLGHKSYTGVSLFIRGPVLLWQDACGEL